MPWTKYKLILCFASLSAISALPACATNPTVIDSFCTTYQRVIRAEGDGNIQAKLGVKQRLAANELYYRRNCTPTSTPVGASKSTDR